MNGAKCKEYELICDEIGKASESNQLVVFVGAGMSNNFGFPTWNGLVGKMYEELTGKEFKKGKSFSSDELLRIPQALRSSNKVSYERILKECFGAHRVRSSENAILDEIIKLKPKHIITTNFDILIEKFLRDKEEALYKKHSAKEGYAKLVKSQVPYHYMTVVRDADMVSANANHLLLKIHGDVQHMDSLILCEDDYLEYSESHILMENFIKSLLINHTFLFVGYGVGDSNLKLIMKWVDNIVSRQKGNARRKKHILLYTEDKAMDGLQRIYFEQKQIQILEFCMLPLNHRKKEVVEFSDKRGKNLLSILRAVASDLERTSISDKSLEEIFTFFEKRKYIHTWEIAAWTDGERYGIRKLDAELLLWKGLASTDIINEVIKRSKKRGKDPLSVQARLFLEKLNIEGYRYPRKDNTYGIISASKQDFIADACLTNNYTELYKYIKENGEYSYSEKACWAMYIDNRKDAEKWLKKQWDSKDKMDLFEYLRFAHNLQQNFELEKEYGISFELLWTSVPEEEKKRQVLIEEYTTDFTDLYYEFGRVADKLRLRYSLKNSTPLWPFEYEEFMVCRTAILDFVAALVLNGFYITGLWACTTSHGNITNLLNSYADVILFLLSPECRRKQEWFKLLPWDIYVLINMVDRQELKNLLEKYNLSKLDVDSNIREILWKNCDNLLDFCEKRISRKRVEGHLCARRAESCMMLMNLVNWEKEEAEPLIRKIFAYLTKLMPLNKDVRSFYVSAHIFYSFLEEQYRRENKKSISVFAEELFKKLIRRFLKEDHLNRYSDVLEYNADSYRDTGSVVRFIDKENNQISVKLIEQFWKCYQTYYSGTVSWLLIDIFPFAKGRIQQEITLLANRKIKSMEITLLRAFLERDILSYSDEVEQVLLDKCQRFAGLSDKQRGESGSQYSPLTHILRLWQNEKIPQIDIFREYKWVDPWFSFVCFPEEFDYEEFDVERWCTWLDEAVYRGTAFNKSREVLKNKFREALETGAAEEVRRIYYKYLE